MNYNDLIGSIAAFLTTISMLPQTIKTVKTRDTRSISILYIFILTTGLLSWTYYGYLLKDFIIIIANGTSFILSFIILAIKIINSNKNSNR